MHAPQPHTPWTTVLQATTAAPECPSPGFPPGSPPAAGTSEDCLYLKVEVPAGTKPGEKLPVMYEVHGGGFLGTALTNDGDNLVNSGKVVYVFANYRLGILGFLADKALGSHSGDYGLQDQPAGLRWVQQNIASFGGNPGDVTVFGESASGASLNQVASPRAPKGLFERAISVSGFYNYQNNIVWSKADCRSTSSPKLENQKVGRSFCAAKRSAAATSPTSPPACGCVPAATLVEDGGQYAEPTAGGTIGPIVNGTTLTMSPARRSPPVTSTTSS